MKIRIDTQGDVSIVSIDGNILLQNVPVFKMKLLDLTKQAKVKIVLDMVSTNYINSTCLAAIVEVKKKLNDIGGDLKLSGINQLVRNLLETTVLIRKIEIFDDVDSAVRSFTSTN
jgi:anti-sigma B factor antagonist